MNALSKVELNQKVTHFNMKLTELIENYSNEVGINSERTKIAYRDDVAHSLNILIVMKVQLTLCT